VTASLTRGSIRPSKAKTFWSYSPAAQEALAAHPGCLLAMGLGEAPLFRQCTFTLWKDEGALDGYARSGAHLAASRAALQEGHFSESLFARFRPYAARGRWRGTDVGQLGVPETP
jgi:spheroidene monooxygenase